MTSGFTRSSFVWFLVWSDRAPATFPREKLLDNFVNRCTLEIRSTLEVDGIVRTDAHESEPLVLIPDRTEIDDAVNMFRISHLLRRKERGFDPEEHTRSRASTPTGIQTSISSDHLLSGW